MSARVSIAENRRELRRPGQGLVEVRWEIPSRQEVSGKLVDVSSGGFRMAHTCAALTAGTLVEFSHQEARGNARAVWSRLLGETVETGFLVL